VRISPGGSSFSAGAEIFTTAQFALSTTATMIAAANPKRRAVVVIKTGNRDIFLGPTNTVTATTGALFAGSRGGSATLHVTGEVWAVLGNGTETVTILEEVNP
jgi:hypothetical protein